MMRSMVRTMVVWILLWSLATAETPPAKTRPRQLWMYAPSNLAVDANIDKLQALFTRAHHAGYNHVLLTDSKFSRLGQMDAHYFANVERVKKLAAEQELKLVPALFPVGYANDLLSNNPNLAEGLPVKDQPFVIHDGQAQPEPQTISLVKPSFADDCVNVQGNTATVSAHDGPARMIYAMVAEPYRCYHLSATVQTTDYTGHPELKALANGHDLQYQTFRIQRTQAATRVDVVFNSLDNTDIKLYFGDWNRAAGTLQWSDWKIEPAGLVNILRRPGTPLKVTSEDGKKAFKEGVDFDPVADPRLGTVPWPGQYEAWHDPAILKIKANRIPDGTRLRISWFHPAIIYQEQVSACISEPEHRTLLVDQAKRMKTTFGSVAAGWMMSHDEIRTLNQDAACEARHLTPGQMLAENIRECRALLGASPAYVWSDMFDPTHNAVPGPYYLVRGPWTDAWLGLSKDVTIMNWNFGKRDESLKFFADRGHHQIIAGYYDEPSLEQTRGWITAVHDVPNVDGFMYTTWENNYDALERFAELVKE